MTLIADIFMIAGAFGAAVYCIILSKRLAKLQDLEQGVGGAVSVLSSQVNDLSKTLENARQSADSSNDSLKDLTERAENVSSKIELLLASMHDLQTVEPPKSQPFFSNRTQSMGERG